MSDAGIAKIMAFSENVLIEAKNALFTRKPKYKKEGNKQLFAWFFGVCKGMASDYKEPLNWEMVEFLKKTFNIDRDQPDSFQTEEYKWPEKTNTSISYKTTTTFCKSCENRKCICGARSDEITCICFKKPNRKCRGFERATWKLFHPLAAYEHFEKFKNVKGLAFLSMPPEFNPFKEDYENYLHTLQEQK